MSGAQVLRDPKQKRFFKSKDIHDLFTLGPQYAGASETASIFSSLHGGLEVPWTLTLWLSPQRALSQRQQVSKRLLLYPQSLLQGPPGQLCKHHM